MARRTDPLDLSCRHMSEMIQREMQVKLASRYSCNGVIPVEKLEPALDEVKAEIREFESSPTGPSRRNAMVLALVRRVCVERLGRISKLILSAIDAGEGLQVEALDAT